jgi:hypothetical protein
MKNFDTISLLFEWGKWSRGRNSLGAKSSMLLVMQLVQPASLNSSPDIGDDAALLVDRAVAQLRLRDGQLFVVLDLYFVRNLSMREIESRMKLSKFNAAKLFSRACGCVEGALINFSEAA